MLFTSMEFLIFLAGSVLVYYLLPQKYQWFLLLGISLVFYYSIGRKLIVFALFAGGVAWAAGCLLARLLVHEDAAVSAAKAAGVPRAARNAVRRVWVVRRRLVLAAALGCLLGLLLVFKFYNMAAACVSGIFSLPVLRFAMPLGISFYTLQLVGYLCDIHTKRISAEPNLFRVLLFTLWFPQVIQGPISRFGALGGELFAGHRFDYERFVLGCEKMLWGYFLKLMIADRFAVPANAVFDSWADFSGLVVAAGAFFYVVQLYADFSGGIAIALGAAELFGISMPENFNRPFSSQSIEEFWRRWHITLGTFLRDYIFYPLTLSKPFARLGKWLSAHVSRPAGKWLPSYLAMFILWFCSGVWHGEGAHYVLYGMYHGSLIVLGMLIAAPAAAFWSALHVPQQSRSLAAFRVARTCILVGIGEIIFRAESCTAAVAMLRSLFTRWDLSAFPAVMPELLLDTPDWLVGFLALGVFFAASLFSAKTDLRVWVFSRPLPLRWTILLGGIALIAVFGVYGAGYDPTPFVYFQF